VSKFKTLHVKNEEFFWVIDVRRGLVVSDPDSRSGDPGSSLDPGGTDHKVASLGKVYTRGCPENQVVHPSVIDK
jgi:hypothetical protein